MKYSGIKRAVSGALAGMLLLSCTSGAVTSYAASTYGIKFIADDAETTTVIEGGVVNAQATLPPGHTFNTDPAVGPFSVKINGVKAPDGLITIAANSGTHYTITANDFAASGAIPPGVSIANPNEDKYVTYTLEPNLTASLVDGNGTLDIVAKPDSDPNDDVDDSIPAGFYTMAVKSTGKPLPITADSSFTFQAASGEVDGVVTFTNTTGGTGYFQGLNMPVAIQEPITTSGNKKVIKISLGAANYSFDLSVIMSAKSQITAGSTFTINYRLQGINPLIMEVITPMRAVKQTVASIKANPVDPLVPDKYKIPYVKLASGDTLSSITTDFHVLSQVERYNSKAPNLLHVDWGWIADADIGSATPQFQNVVTFGPDGRQTRTVQLEPRQDDVKGKLKVKVEYPLKKPYNGETKVISLEETLDVTILGVGIPPTLTPLTQTVGQNPSMPITLVPSNMDVYDGKLVATPPQPPILPYTFDATMLFGSGRGRAEKAVIRAEGVTPDALKVYLDGSPVPYDFGTDITNTDQVAGRRSVKILAIKRGSVRLYFDYYVKNNKGQLVKADSSQYFEIIITDTTPSDFAQLSSLILQSPDLAAEELTQYPGGAIDFGFKTDTYLYSSIELPYNAKTLNISPAIPPNKGVVPLIDYEISGGGPTDGIPLKGTVEANKVIGGKPLPMEVENSRTITLTVTAENGRKQLYILTINRMPPSRDSSLKELTVTDKDGVAILKGFSPTQTEYAATVPYGTRWARFDTAATNPWATVNNIPVLIPRPGDLLGQSKWMRLLYPNDPFVENGVSFNGPNVTEQKITVNAQDGTLYPNGARMYTTTYSVKITRADPSKNNLASALGVKDHKDRPMTFDNGVKFDKNTKKYSLHIPYSADKLSLSILPDDILAQNVAVTFPGGVGVETVEQPYMGDKVPLDFTVNTPVSGGTASAFTITFTVKAESDEKTTPPYTITVVRNDPDLDDTLTALEVKDQNDAPVKTFSFNPQTSDYVFSVPFSTEQVRVVPKPRSPLATVKVNGEIIDERQPSYVTLLKPGETKNIKVEIFPEDRNAAPRVYNLTVTRELPSTDARLKELLVNGGVDFSPRFLPATTIYQVNIPEGTKNITFTATPLVEGSTVTINGIDTPPGKPSDIYEPYDAKTVVKIEVTAQDGKTKMTYTINVTNLNLISKSSNADLEKLEIREGSMSPRFKPGVTEYEVAVKDDVSAVDILPVTRSEEASLKVFSDTKQLGDYYDRYSTFIRDGENIVTVEVTAEDGKTKKEYQVTIFRKDEEKQGNYKPVTADMVDFTTNPIVVDISRYTVVAAEVFNILKEDYPDKTMVFQGNDYSLQLTGKDMDMLVPHAATYDLGLTFSSPNEDAIWDFISSYPRNDSIEPVLIHFNHHGALPGKMLFTISLGREYRTQNATWNYYNEERDRIDYYGGVRTNSRGTFTVPITHMSTYLYCKDRIDGAENKTGELGQIGSNTGGSSVNKPNPNTGVGGQGR